MKLTGTIYKMVTKLNSYNAMPNVEYLLPIGNKQVNMNSRIGSYIHFIFLKEIYCVLCNRKISKSFAQGYCYPCFLNSPETSECILRPELCQAHDGIARDMEWAEKYCLQTHFVYLALSSNIKVGVTRSTQIPTRWIDQGATQAIKFAETPNRYLAGLIEVEIKKYISDRTSWQQMLKNILVEGVDLYKSKSELLNKLRDELKLYQSNNHDITQLFYPVDVYPEKVKSIGFDKNEEIFGLLSGIKGQYLIFDDGRVLNIRKHNGYKIQMEL